MQNSVARKSPLQSENYGQNISKESEINATLSSIKSTIQSNLSNGLKNIVMNQQLSRDLDRDNIANQDEEKLQIISDSKNNDSKSNGSPSEPNDVFVLTKVIEDNGSIRDVQPQSKSTSDIYNSSVENANLAAASQNHEESQIKGPDEDNQVISDNISADFPTNEDSEIDRTVIHETQSDESKTTFTNTSSSDISVSEPFDNVENNIEDSAKDFQSEPINNPIDEPFSQADSVSNDREAIMTTQTSETEEQFFENVNSVQEPSQPKNDTQEDIASSETLSESAAAFAALTQMTKQMQNVNPQKSSTQKVDEQNAGQYTVDDLMRELLRPLLKDWLDAHLPSLVKWLVTEQIEKILQQQLGFVPGKTDNAPQGQQNDNQGKNKSSNETSPSKTDPNLNAKTDFDAIEGMM